LAKKNSIEYQDITIQESNLDWISDGIEQDLPPCIELEAEDSDLSSSFQDQGPSISQTAEMLDEQEDSIWHITWNSTAFTQTERRFYNKLLQQATKKPTIRIKKATINFPYVSQTPVSEYDTNSGLFSKAFPWLFQVEEVISINSEIQNLLFLTGLRTYYYMKMAVLQR
jgi:hypothetical protein